MIPQLSKNGFKLDIQENILEQFANQLELPIIDNQVTLTSSFGKGTIVLHSFPQQLELYHLQFKANTPVKMNSQNPPNSDWLLININLSTTSISKTVNQQELDIQKYLPSGMLFYTPRTEVHSVSPANIPFEIALVRFPKSFLTNYIGKKLSNLQNTQNALIYEDLDNQSEMLLLSALTTKHNTLKRHSTLLGFLSIFIDKLMERTQEEKYQNLHPDDVKGLFLAAAQLRNPLLTQLLSLDELAKLANMGMTKFKNCFKQVFGMPPMKYRQQIRMTYAQQQLIKRQKNISEISYELGYSHPSKFTLAYKKQFGTLPSNL